jgi:hypothetical protein
MMSTRKMLAAGLAVATVVLVPLAGPATAGTDDDGDGEVTFEVTLDGNPIEDGETVELDPARDSQLALLVENGTDDDVVIEKVRVAGDALGLTFFTFTTRIDVVVEAGESEDRAFALDLTDLDGQASGLLDGRVELINDENRVIASEGFTADAQGSLTSTFSLFGLLVALLTAVLLLGVIRSLRKETLPRNRFSRAIRFAEPGAGLGMVMTFTLSTLRIVLVPSALGILLVVIGAGIGFTVGYTLSSVDDDDEADAAEAVAAPAPAVAAPIPSWTVPGPTSVGEVLR